MRPDEESLDPTPDPSGRGCANVFASIALALVFATSLPAFFHVLWIISQWSWDQIG